MSARGTSALPVPEKRNTGAGAHPAMGHTF
nr:MAG TPA: hypothetical protein [Caudoviricetes sp.]